MADVYADVELTKAINKRGFEQDCVIVTCQESGDSTPEVVDGDEEPVWGHSPKSVRRALALLSENCSCGSRYHKAPDGEDEDD